jgi:hypothetical protein
MGFAGNWGGIGISGGFWFVDEPLATISDGIHSIRHDRKANF